MLLSFREFHGWHVFFGFMLQADPLIAFTVGASKAPGEVTIVAPQLHLKGFSQKPFDIFKG